MSEHSDIVTASPPYAPDSLSGIRSTDDLAARAVSSAAWSTFAIVGQRGLSLLSTLVLARLLAPSAIGLLGMAMVLITAIYTFKDLGTSSAIIQRKTLDGSLASSLFWTNMLIGISGTALIAVIAPGAAALYHEPRVAPILTVLAPVFFINSLGVVHRAILQRAMLFRRISMIQLSASAVSAAAGISMAVAGAGVWSLVAAVLCEVTAAVTLYSVLSGWCPRWHFSLRELRAVTGYSANLTGSNLASYFMRNIDKALIGRFLGPAALGYYALAYGLMMYPLYNVSFNLGNVLFPAFSRIQEEQARFRQGYLRAITVIATVTFPLMLGLLATADLLVSSCFGAKWTPMVPIVRILAPVGMLQSITSTTGIIFTSKGRTDLQFRWALVEVCVVLCAFVVGLRWGTIGMAGGYGIAVLLLCYPEFAISGRLIALRPSEVARTLWPVTKNAVVMLAVVLLTRSALPRLGLDRTWLAFGTTVAVGFATYIFLLRRSRPAVLRDVLGLLQLGGLPWLRRLTGLYSD